MAYLVVGIGLALALLGVLGWWSRTDVATAKKSLMGAAFVIAIALGLLLLATGRGFFAALPIGFAAWQWLSGKLLTGGRGRGGPPGGHTAIERAEALSVLGLEDPVTRDDVEKAYKKMIARCHPDQGGSDWMAAKVNAARQFLLQGLE